MSAIKAFSGRIPLLGVCLGHQAIAEVFGGEIVHAKFLMHGKTSNVVSDGRTIYHQVGSPFKAMRYHSLAVNRASLPTELVAISVLTDKRFFMGGPKDLRQARAATHLPVLRKEFIISAYQVFESAALGADVILLIARILELKQLRRYLKLSQDLNLEALVEVHSSEDIKKVSQTDARLVGINNRDLTTFHIKDFKRAQYVTITDDEALAAFHQVCVLELGVPFSDPTSNGPVIQRSSHRSLQSKTSLTAVLQMTRRIRDQIRIPIILFSYYNPIFRYGCERLARDAVHAGADGVLVVDLPPEESDEMTAQWQDAKLKLICLVAPKTPPDRMAMIAKRVQGFLYQVSKTGVTGSMGINLKNLINRFGS